MTNEEAADVILGLPADVLRLKAITRITDEILDATREDRLRSFDIERHFSTMTYIIRVSHRPNTPISFEP